MNLRQETVRGTMWSGLENIGKNIIYLLITIVLARLLNPADFGLIELIVVFTSISQVILDSGFSQALIREQKTTEVDFCSVFYFNIFVGICIYIILYLTAPFIADFYRIPELSTISRVLFLVVIFSAFSIIQTTIAAKRFDFRILSISSLFSYIIAGVISIVVAYKGGGVWSLVLFYLGQTVLRTVFLWICDIWRPQLLFSFSSIKKLFLFSSNLLANGLLDVIFTNLQSLVVGRYYSKADLGYYSQAKRLQSIPSQTIVAIVQKVSYSTLSTVQDEDVKVKLGYEKIIGITTYVLFPIMFFMLASAETLFNVILSSQWLPAVEYFRPLCLIGIMLPFQSVNTNIFLIKGKSALYLQLSIFRKALVLISLLLAIKVSILALVWGLVVAYVVTSFIFMYFAGKLINYSLTSQLYDSIKNAGIAILSFFPVYFLNAYSSVSVIDLLVQSAVYLLLFVGLSYLTKNINYQEILQILKNVKKR